MLIMFSNFEFAVHGRRATDIFISRRHYRNVADTKSGKRHEMMARLSSKPQQPTIGFVRNSAYF